MNTSDAIRETIRTALIDYREGRLEEARSACLKILENVPGDPDCLYLLGLIVYNRREFDLAVQYFQRTIDSYPGHADAYLNMGNAFQEKGRYEEAVACYRSAAALCPGNADIHNNLGVALTACGEIDQAVECYQTAIGGDPDNAMGYNNLGNALRIKGHFEGAVQCFKKALQLNPDSADFYKNMGNALRDKGEMAEAMASFREALRLRDGDAEIHYNIANLYKETGRAEAAAASYREALRIDPLFLDACYNLGNVLRESGRYDEAIGTYRRALGIDPDYFEAYNNMGVAFKEKGDTANSIGCYQKALEINPTIPEAQWNLSLVYLLAGEFSEGWKRYEWRWEKADYRLYLRHFSQPLWDGSDIAGKTILLHAEQGYGDAIQFVRYVPLVAKTGAKVIVEVPGGLVTLCETVDGAARVIRRGDDLPVFDCHCPLLTLPMVFQTQLSSIPDRIPYLAADKVGEATWHERLVADGGGFRVGLVWSGNPEHKNDRNRSIPMEKLVPLLDTDRVLFYSLQKGKAAEVLNGGTYGRRIIDYTEDLNDFADTAALLANLDLVISVDTAVAHLAGAMGRSVWLMLPHAPDWRWLLKRDDSPWYPTMRLFRQPAPGDWEKVIDEMIAGLRRCVAEGN